MLYTLLANEGEGSGNTAGSGYGNWIMLAILAVLIVVVVVMYVLGNKKRKKQEQDAKDLINAVKPGNKVKTIGGICGIVVEVDDEENTFVLETGTELSGKSYMKFDRQAIYQTDAVVEKPDANVTVTDEPATEEATDATEENAQVTEAVEVSEPVEVAETVEPAPVESVPVEESIDESKFAPKKGKKK